MGEIMSKDDLIVNTEHIARWATLFDLQMDAAIANVQVVDIDKLLDVLESTSQIYQNISKRSKQLITDIRMKRLQHGGETI